jgi:phage-related tail protein
VLFDLVLKMKGIALDALMAQQARLREHGGEEYERAAAELREVRKRVARIMLERRGP